ncbi:hypothetical protein MKW94_016085 [Papaver nudicaule]|uniref:Chaperonin-like RbcX protein n=1 Tax=Papaver nudicaule TaxID=74823 RepID=A0AA41VYZ1_PAPNU|nr:hypothetical protein [Papaver nudicaule]
MVGALSVMGVVVDTKTRPCLCLDTLSSSTIHMKSSGELSFYKKRSSSSGQLELSSSFVDAWHEWRLSAKVLSGVVYQHSSKRKNISRGLVIVNNLGGQYEESFEDVKRQVINYFTYKAVRTVLNQLYEMNPTNYRWFYDFTVNNNPGDGKRFLRALAKEKVELAERVMITRLHLYGKWIKKCDHAAMYKDISEQNLELMRERLMETVIWPSDDTNTEKIG